jgi:aromatic ring hydroxylase
MNQDLNIMNFLDFIDPEKTIDRKKAVEDITTIVLLEAVGSTIGKLSDKHQKEVKKTLKESNEPNFETVYNLFVKIGKKQELLTALDENIVKVRQDYIRTHLKSMSQEKREQVYSKFPILKEVDFNKKQ